MIFFSLHFPFFVQKGGSGLGIGPFTFFVNKFHRYSRFFASTANMFIVHTTIYDLLHCIIVKVWQQPSSCSSLIFFPGPPTTEWDPPSLWVLHLFFFHNFDFITRRSLSLSLSSGGLYLYLYQQEVLFNLIVCAVYLAASSLLATSVYMQVVNEHHLIHHKMPSYVRFPAMKNAFCSCSTITGSSLDSRSIPLSLPPMWVDS